MINIKEMTQQYILDHQYLIIVMTLIVAGLIHTITALRSSFLDEYIIISAQIILEAT